MEDPMKSKTAISTVVTAPTFGRHMIDPRRSEPGITQGMREAAARIAKAVLKERSTPSPTK